MSDDYRTNSIALAAAIVATTPTKLSFIEWGAGNRATFLFDRKFYPELDKIVELFWQKNLPCDCSTYFEALRYVKSRLHEKDR